MNALKGYVTAIEVALFLAFCAGLVWFGHHITALSYDAKIAQARADGIASVASKEHVLQATVDKLTANAATKDGNAKVNETHLRDDYATGRKRLSVGAVCRPENTNPNPTVEHTETRAELLPANAASVIGVANDANDTVRDLNRCVDQYNAVRNELMPSR